MQRHIAIHQFFWTVESHRHQGLAWEDARIARVRTEHQAAIQLQAMLDANLSGSLGHAQLNDIYKLKDAGLL